MTSIHLTTIDFAILGIYFLFVLGIGFALKSRMKGSTDFFLSGRSIPAWVTGLAFLSANLGAQEVIGMAASGAKYGIMTTHFYWVGAIPAMVFLAIFISIGGYVFFGDRLTPMQLSGCVLALGGVTFLSFWHRHVSVLRTIGWLALLGLLYAPIFLIEKKLLLDGINPIAVFFWAVLPQKALAFILPWLTPFGHRNKAIWKRLRPATLGMNFISSSFSIAGCLFFTFAYKDGLASLVSVTENTQPFIAMALAALLVLFVPRYAPKELLTRESVTVKLLSLTAVTAGMVLLVI